MATTKSLRTQSRIHSFGDFLDVMKQRYRELKAGRPGRRFQELHERRASRGTSRKPWIIAIGLALLGVGIALMILPGPGIPFVFVGAGLVSQEMFVVARAFDHCELTLRQTVTRVKRWMRRTRKAAKA